MGNSEGLPTSEKPPNTGEATMPSRQVPTKPPTP